MNSFGKSSIVAIPKLPESFVKNQKVALDIFNSEKVLDESDCFTETAIREDTDEKVVNSLKVEIK